jgi:DNA polymerase I
MTTPAAGASDVCYLIDLSTWVHRFFHATPVFRGPNGKPANAIKGIAQLIARLFRDQRPRYVAAALDSPGHTFRHDLFPAYKAERKPRPAELSEQFDAIRQLLDLHHIHCLELPAYEADDLIATATAKLRALGLSVVIVALDKDLHQLVEGEHVVLWDTKETVWTAREVESRWGVPPSQLCDLMALIGDPTDGIPGVAGIGKKTAAELLQKRQTLDEVLRKASWETSRALRAKLTNGADAARLSRDLVRLRSDAPIAFELEDLRTGWEDGEPIRAFYREYGFSDLARQVRP